MKRGFRCDGSIVPPLGWTMESHGCHSCLFRSRVVTLVSVSSLEWFFSFLWLRFEWIVGAGFPALSSCSLSYWDGFPIDPFGRPWMGPFHHPGNVLANPSIDAHPSQSHTLVRVRSFSFFFRWGTVDTFDPSLSAWNWPFLRWHCNIKWAQPVFPSDLGWVKHEPLHTPHPSEHVQRQETTARGRAKHPNTTWMGTWNPNMCVQRRANETYEWEQTVVSTGKEKKGWNQGMREGKKQQQQQGETLDRRRDKRSTMQRTCSTDDARKTNVKGRNTDEVHVRSPKQKTVLVRKTVHRHKERTNGNPKAEMCRRRFVTFKTRPEENT